MSVRGILTVTNGALEAGAEQQGAARDPARRAERLPAGPNVATAVRDVRRISMWRVVAHAPGKQLAPALFRKVSAPGSSMCDGDRLRSFPHSLYRLAL
jgi:hypothetical protein